MPVMDIEERRATLRGEALRIGIPRDMSEGLIEYILLGRPVGHFLTAVLENNLREACNRADERNQKLIYQYVFFLYNYAPVGAWGSEENVETWKKHRGFEFEEEANHD